LTQFEDFLYDFWLRKRDAGNLLVFRAFGIEHHNLGIMKSAIKTMKTTIHGVSEAGLVFLDHVSVLPTLV